MFRRHVRLSVLVLMVPLAIAVGGDRANETVAASAAAGVEVQAGGKVDPATAGGMTGKVVLVGTAPKNEVIKLNADPECVKLHPTPMTQETFMVGPGNTLQNVFVYVKDGLGQYTFEAPKTPVVIDQRQCHYSPHVFGIRVGQPLEVRNSDPTLHNIHAMPYENFEFNFGQPVEGMKTTKTFTEKEVMVPFKCDVHGWMNAYAGVLDHPYFAVSGADGKFEIRTLPPGTYTIEAWHEKLGAMTQKVTIGPKQTQDVTFTFKTIA